MCDVYQDWRGQPIKVGDRVRFGVEENPPGVISRIDPPDGDYDDDLGRGVLYPPKVWVKYPGDHPDWHPHEETEDWATGYNVNTSFYEDPIWEFEDIELLTCEGHPAGPFDPMGQTVYCDGSCRS